MVGLQLRSSSERVNSVDAPSAKRGDEVEKKKEDACAKPLQRPVFGNGTGLILKEIESKRL